VVRQSGIPQEASIQTLRHASATQLLERGVSRRVMQARLGHMSPRTTTRSTPLTPPTLDVVPAPITALMADLWAGRSLSLPEVADDCRRDGPEALDRVGQDLLPSHRRALEALRACRTEALGGQLWQGDRCGQEHDVYHSCRHCSGPTCPHLDTDAWLAERQRELLPVPDVHVVFPVPQEWRAIIRRPQQDLYDLWLRAAAPARLTLAADPPDVGGLSGVLGVLHTWTPTLTDHPHVHCRVPAGRVSADRTPWQPARRSSRGPVHALSPLFGGVFRALVRQERPDLTIPASVWTKGWVVYGKPALQGPERGLTSLGRDVHRLALTTSRLLAIEDGHVCFR
jgi:hypothetical protein